MRRRAAAILLSLLCTLAVVVVFGACGAEEEETEVAEGEPIEVAGLEYNIQLTRFLNPDDNEDAEYLVGQPPAEPGNSYLGVFLTIANETDVARPSAEEYIVTDTLGTEYEVLESESPYALELSAEVPAEAELPLPDTTAQTGPNQGSLLIFGVSDDVSENRPLRLAIEAVDDTGEVILDI